MKKLKKFLLYLGLILLLLLLFRGPFFRMTVNYTPVSDRGTFKITNPELLAEISKKHNNQELSFIAMIDLANEMTTQRLQFSDANISQNPNETFQSRRANCVGYAALFSSIFTQLAHLQNSDNRYATFHHIGRLDFLGVDLHQFFNSPFFRDHDFNAVHDIRTKEVVYIDSSLSDYFWINRVSSVNRPFSRNENPSFQGISKAFIWVIILVLFRVLVLIIKRISKNQNRR